MRSLREFLVELKKRRVYRVAVGYAVVAWAAVEVTTTVIPELGLAGWIPRAVIIAALLGFPLALVLAWVYDFGPGGLQRAAAPDAAPDGARAFTASRAAAIAGVVLIGAGGLGAYAYRHGGADIPRGAALTVALTQLADSGAYATAFDLAARARDAGEEVPDSVAARFTDLVTVLSEPTGARVSARRFVRDRDAAADTVLVQLGTTPLRGVPIARGDYFLRIEHAGHAPVERIASSAALRVLFPARSSELRIDVQLQPADGVPDGMVHVPGGLYRVASRDLQSLAAELRDFFIDRHEVTNEAFGAFVDAGGYTRTEYWSDLFEERRADAADLLRGMVDRTGLPAPREWTGQRPPAGLERHPVTGVSWYEAAAYCRYRRAALPTLFEWEKAARNGRTSPRGIEVPWGYAGPGESPSGRANFASTGTLPVGSFPFGVSAYGAYDMAGNAKEWLRNGSESGRAVAGGSWADPLYVFAEVGSVAPESTSPTTGFRCARISGDDRGTAGGQGDQPLRLAVETPVYTPVDDATFRGLLTHYEYDRQPLEAVVEERIETPRWTRERITYAGPGDQRVLAYLFLPKSGTAPYQTIVYVPSSLALLGMNVATLVETDLGALIRGGRAVFTVVMEGMTEREYPAGYEPPASSSVAFRDQMVRRGIELRRGLDYLETRTEIDATRIAYLGSSFGAGSRLLFAAIDDRFRAVVLVGAGIDERVHPTLPEASNINFAPRIRAPKIVVNGRLDEEHPWLTRALPLWNLLSEPKELALFDNAGHLPAEELRIPVIRDFLDRQLR